MVSIHAPRTGGDEAGRDTGAGGDRFNPRPPHGGRRKGVFKVTKDEMFQSTPPARGATHVIASALSSSYGFNPRPPHGGRLQYCLLSQPSPKFQSTPPARGATRRNTFITRDSKSFNPRPPHGGRQWWFQGGI